jgi:succinate dehydrogenase / fumarate reductase flavoprotein subunit
MMIYPANHYTMGGLWVDYGLMTTIPGLFAIGETNFSDHGANRLGASGLMQGLADGYFILPSTLGDYLAGTKLGPISADGPAFRDAAAEIEQRIGALLALRGRRTVDEVHRELGFLLWNNCSMVRSAAGLQQALSTLPTFQHEFWHNVSVPGGARQFNQPLERALRLADYLEFAPLLLHDALRREESCGTHFREEYQTPDGEARRDDEHYAYVAAWEYRGPDEPEKLHKEPLRFEMVEPTARSYK